MSIEIPIIAANTLTVLSPFLQKLAPAAAEAIGTKVPDAVGALWKAIKQRFDKKAAAREVLEDMLKNPDDGDFQAAFRAQLKKILTEDEGFAAQLQTLLDKAAQEIPAEYKARLKGSGAIAQGSGAKAVGERGVMIGGNAEGNLIITGDKNKVEKQDD